MNFFIGLCPIESFSQNIKIWSLEKSFLTTITISSSFLEVSTQMQNKMFWLILTILRTHSQYCQVLFLAPPQHLVVDLPYHLLEWCRCQQLGIPQSPLLQQCWSHWGKLLLLWVANEEFMTSYSSQSTELWYEASAYHHHQLWWQ